MAVAVRLFCALCGLPAPAPIAARIGGEAHTFCCGGCRQVYQILLESDQLGAGQDPTQTTLYQQCLQMGLIARPGEPTPPPGAATLPKREGEEVRTTGLDSYSSPLRFGEGGEPQRAGRGSDSLQTTREAAFQVGGMWCSACAWLIEHALGQVKGVESARVFFASDMVKVVYRPARVAPETLAAVIHQLGYSAEPYSGENGQPDSPQARARKNLLIRAVVASVFAVNAGMFQLPFYADFFQRQGLSGDAVPWLPRIELLFSLPVLIAGWPVFQKAWAALRRGAAIMETLIALGVGVSFAYSVWTLAHGGVHVYFDTADMLLALVLVGKHIEAGARHDATGAVALLHGLLPKKAMVKCADGRETLTALDKLRVGDRMVVRPGERIPCDGQIVDGAALVDESLLSGEARPVAKKPGDAVTGGTVATDAPLLVEVTRTGADTTLSQMIALVEEALAAKSPVERWADQISRRFVPAIIALAALTGLTLLLLGHAPADCLVRAVTVLVIACPCALALATPLAITTGVGAAASRGILIGNTDVLQVLPRVRHLLLDKTGTLTEGRFAVREFAGNPEDLPALAALEDASEHPLARALVSYARSQSGADFPAVTHFTRREGQGVTGNIDGALWFIGNRALCAAQNAFTADEWEPRAQAAEADGLTALFYGIGSRVRGLITLGDALRPGATEAVQSLSRLGLAPEVVSGDALATTQAIARRVGLSRFTAQMRPEDKAARVRELQSGSTPSTVAGRGDQIVALAGDGINDAPALAQADVGIAFGSGTEIARRAADITLIGDDLRRLADLFTLARQTARVIRQNLFWACLYNAVCIPLAVLGVIKNPVFAAGAMLLSSLSVVLNTKRLRRILARTE